MTKPICDKFSFLLFLIIFLIFATSFPFEDSAKTQIYGISLPVQILLFHFPFFFSHFHSRSGFCLANLFGGNFINCRSSLNAKIVRNFSSIFLRFPFLIVFNDLFLRILHKKFIIIIINFVLFRLPKEKKNEKKRKVYGQLLSRLFLFFFLSFSSKTRKLGTFFFLDSSASYLTYIFFFYLVGVILKNNVIRSV